MKFIDIEQRAPKGRGFSDEPHRSTLTTDANGLHVLGIIPHGTLIRPASTRDRDNLITYLKELDYQEKSHG